MVLAAWCLIVGPLERRPSSFSTTPHCSIYQRWREREREGEGEVERGRGGGENSDGREMMMVKR